MFGFEMELAKVGIGDSSAQLVVILSTIQCPLNVFTKWWVINVIKKIEAADDVVIFPQGTFGFVFSGVCTEFPNNNALSCRFQGQGDDDTLEIIPLLNDKGRVDFPDGLEQHAVVLTRVLESIERFADFIVEISVAGSELIAEQM